MKQESRGIDGVEGLYSEAATSFDLFYESNRAQLYRALALTLRDPALAREAVDEAMTRALERWEQVGAYRRPAGWVYRVGFNWATSLRRKRSREVAGPLVEPRVEDGLPEPEVAQAVSRLPLKQRAVVVARFYLDWSVEDTAAALEIPIGTVKSRLSRALDRLSEDLR